MTTMVLKSCFLKTTPRLPLIALRATFLMLKLLQ